MLEWGKRWVRLAEAALTPRVRVLPVDGKPLRLVRSYWWDDTMPACFEQEIGPYFRALAGDTRFRVVLDAGAAGGLFSLAACVRFPGARIIAFEPSRRQRMLLRRNVNRNGFADRVRIEPYGLWNAATTLRFRSHGGLSSLRGVGAIPLRLAFGESVPVVRLDDWLAREGIEAVDLVKMDIEGAEIEALEGARNLLGKFRPVLLVQAYHERDGVRTWNRCEAFLREQGYAVTGDAEAGLMLARPASRVRDDPGVR